MPASGQPGQYWGWHALVDEWAATMVADAGVRQGELVLDVGAGEGALTAQLVQAGARVIAVELHSGRAQRLRERFADAPVTVVRADASALRLPRRPFRVVANPPYAITAGLMRRLLGPGSRLLAADLVLPRAVVRRYAEGRVPGAGRWAQSFDVRRGRSLPPHAFRPPPRVGAVVLRLRRR